MLGRGAFGEVRRAVLKRVAASVLVAVKAAANHEVESFEVFVACTSDTLLVASA